MDCLAQALVLIGRHADDVEDERALGFRAHHSIDRRQLADCISRRQHRRAPSARVAIGSIGGIQFIRAADPLDVWIAIDCITDWKRVVTRYAETVGDPFISKSLNDIVNYSGRFHKSCSSSFLSQAFKDRDFTKS